MCNLLHYTCSLLWIFKAVDTQIIGLLTLTINLHFILLLNHFSLTSPLLNNTKILKQKIWNVCEVLQYSRILNTGALLIHVTHNFKLNVMPSILWDRRQDVRPYLLSRPWMNLQIISRNFVIDDFKQNKILCFMKWVMWKITNMKAKLYYYIFHLYPGWT